MSLSFDWARSTGAVAGLQSPHDRVQPPTPGSRRHPPTVAVPASSAASAKRPPAWSLSNWPVRWKSPCHVLVPLILAALFGGLRVNTAMASSSGLRLAADRADMLPAFTKYMSALDVALLAGSTGRDVVGAKKNYDARKGELQTRLEDTDVDPDLRAGVRTLLDGRQSLGRGRLSAPRVDDAQIRAQAQGLSRAVAARGQMMMQKILVTRGADCPSRGCGPR